MRACGCDCGCAWLCELERNMGGRGKQGVATNDVTGDPNAPMEG